MEVIRLPGYTEDEKMHIATGYLMPRQLKQHGLVAGAEPVEEPKPETATETALETAPEASTPQGSGEAVVPGPSATPTADGKLLEITEDALRKIIREYTREAGVRNLEREIGAICRKVARKVASHEIEKATVDAADLATYLGPERFEYGLAEKEDMVGAATGVSVSEHGGDVLTVEATTMDQGSKTEEFVLTGQIQKVMEESARAALSYVRAHQAELGVPKGFFKDHAMHIHVPAGAIPKDGPSAGVTMTTAIVSALTGRPVRRDVAMTGEITLRGKVLPIGGVKEKLLAVHRAGITTFILPEKNKKDLVDIPKEVLDTVEVKTVGTIDEVLNIALQKHARITPPAYGPRDVGRPAPPPS
jgi:ATP-dependent Lon protease